MDPEPRPTDQNGGQQPFSSGRAPRTAIVTGGASGLGRGLALALARWAYRVVIADRDPAADENLLAEAGALRPRLTYAELDVTDGAAFDRLIAETCDRYGRFELLVNCAGRGFWGDVRQATLDDWREVLDVNLWGTIHGIRAAYPRMAAQRSGRIVNVASLAGLIPAPTLVPYATAKSAVVGLSLSLRAEAARHGVKVNVVCPGPVRTGFHAALLRVPPDSPARPTPGSSIEVPLAVAEIMRGLDRNRALIVLPARARRLWWTWRLWPSRLANLEQRLLSQLPPE